MSEISATAVKEVTQKERTVTNDRATALAEQGSFTRMNESG